MAKGADRTGVGTAQIKYRPMGIDAVIRVLGSDELGSAMELSTTAGWNQRLDDWRMLRQIAPAGCFAAVVEGRLVGTAIGIDYGAFAWIAMMLVDPAYRGRGLGARLLDAAMAAVPARHPIGLDATPLGRPLYRRFGFRDEAMLTRHVAEGSRQRTVESEAGSSVPVRRIESADLDRIAGVDSAVFGADRRMLLAWTLGQAPHYAYLVETPSTVSYSFGRPGRLFDQIGPIVAATDEEAAALTGAALSNAGGRALVADVFDAQVRFARWLDESGFEPQRPLFRMYRPPANGRTAERGHAASLPFTILGPEFA